MIESQNLNKLYKHSDVTQEKEKSICENIVFESLFYSHSDDIRNYIFYKCGDQQLAEDIVQETFLSLWHQCAKVPFKKAKYFLFRVAKNNFLNIIKHKKVILDHTKYFLPSEITNEDPEFIIEEKEFMIKLQKAILKLSNKQREVFLLNRIDGKKYAEIAVIIGISVKAVEKRMHNALLILRKEIGNV